MDHRIRLLAYLLILLFVSAAAALSANGPAHDLSWHTVDGGGGVSAGASFGLTGTIGQPEAGVVMTGGVFTVTGGFWAGRPTEAPECPGDIDDDGEVTFADLVMLLAAWGACPDCPEDLNDDDGVDFNDLLILLANSGPCPE